MLLDWADISKYQARRKLPIIGNWDPANWDVSAIDWDKLISNTEGILIRLGDGLNLDPCFLRYREALEARDALWGIYQLHRTGIAAGRQESFIQANQPSLPPAGVWADLEFNGGLTGEAYFQNVDHYLLGLDHIYGAPTGIYSGAWFLDPILTRAQQTRWSWRKGWWASYPNLSVPSGWRDAAVPYVLHQYTNAKTWPGLPKPADADRRNPAVPLAGVLPIPLPAPVPPTDNPEQARIITAATQSILTAVDETRRQL